MKYDIVGQRFSRLTAIRPLGGQYATWEFRCDCGTLTQVQKGTVVRGKTKSCGCLDRETRSSRSMGRGALNISGRRFGRLVAVALDHRAVGRTFWRFTCDCGQSLVARKSHVVSGATQSCGCLAAEVRATGSITHGMTHTPEYNTWASMHARCGNENHEAFKNYGGRGITVSERWGEFANFYADMGPRPEGKTLDRINNNEGYGPGNCQWATWEEQAANRRPPSKRPSPSAKPSGTPFPALGAPTD